MSRASFVLSRAVLGVLVLFAAALVYEIAFNRDHTFVGIDFRTYREAAASWLAGGDFYRSFQLAGPYAVVNDPTNYAILYPPVVLWLLVPFVVLPAWLWWAIPIAVIGLVLRRLRPALWTWCVILAAFDLWARVPELFLWGNPGMWLLAAAALGTVVPGAAVAVLAKPTLAPFALFGANRRAWWIGLALFLLACLPFGGMWLDYWRVAANSNLTINYSLWDYPAMALPLVAWLGRQGRSLRTYLPATLAARVGIDLGPA